MACFIDQPVDRFVEGTPVDQSRPRRPETADMVAASPACRPTVPIGGMAESLPLAAAEGSFRSLVRRAARQGERSTFTENDFPAAVLISATELENLEDALAVAQAAERGTGESVRVPHEVVRRRLGLDQRPLRSPGRHEQSTWRPGF
jgi:PHD/YefM family antitoxin component YafN of YafNO toxin-antitoxin module